MELSIEAEARLEEYSWPGNVRELNNEMERAASLSQGSVVALDELSERIRFWKEEPYQKESKEEAPIRFVSPKGSGSLRRNADQVILETLTRCGGNKTRAAKELGMTREGLRKRLKRLEAD
jgi:DNA-binding NtrC family response regulator